MDNPLADPANWGDEEAGNAQAAVDADPENPRSEALRKKIEWYIKEQKGAHEPVDESAPAAASASDTPAPAPAAAPKQPDFRKSAPTEKAPQPEQPYDPNGFASYATSEPGYSAGDAIRSFAAGSTYGQNRRSAALGAAAASAIGPSDPEGIPRNYAAGSQDADIEASEGAANEKAMRDHPLAATVGGLMPIAATSAFSAPAALVRTGLAGRVAWNALHAGAMGDLQRVGEADPQNAAELKDAMVSGAPLPALLSGGLTAVMGGAGKLAQAVGDRMPAASRYLRGVAAGVGDLPEAQRDALIAKVGDKPEQAVGAQIERLGLTKASPFPMTGKGYARAAGPAAEPLGEELGAMLDRNSALDVQMPKADVIKQLRGLQSKFARTAGDEAKTQARTVERAIRDLETNPGYKNKDNLTVRDLHDLKKVYEGQGGFKSGEAPAPPVTAAKKAASRDIATKYRGDLGDTMQSMALREDLPRFNELRGDIGALKTIRGVGLGTEGRTDLASSVARGLHDPVSAFAHGVRDYGADIAATGAKGLGYAARAAGAFGKPVADTPYRVASETISNLAQRGSAPPPLQAPPPALPPPPMPAPQQRAPVPVTDPAQAGATSKGHKQVDALREQMTTDPQSFGPYTQKLQTALESEDGEEFATVVSNLSQTDPIFRTRYAQRAARQP